MRENSPAAILPASPHKILCPSPCSDTENFRPIPVIPVSQLCTCTWVSYSSCLFIVLGVLRYSKESITLFCPVLCLLPLIQGFWLSRGVAVPSLASSVQTPPCQVSKFLSKIALLYPHSLKQIQSSQALSCLGKTFFPVFFQSNLSKMHMQFQTVGMKCSH